MPHPHFLSPVRGDIISVRRMPPAARARNEREHPRSTGSRRVATTYWLLRGLKAESTIYIELVIFIELILKLNIIS